MDNKTLFLVVFGSLAIFLGSVAGAFSQSSDLLVIESSVWSFIGDTTNIIFGNDDTEGNVTVANYLLVGKGIKLLGNATIYFNDTCLFIPSPNNNTIFEICNNQSFHMTEGGIEYINFDDDLAFFDVPVNVDDSIQANYFTGDGGGLFNLSINGTAGNFTGYWTLNGTDISNNNAGNVSINGLQYPEEDGLNNYVMTTDGAGVLHLSPLELSDTADYYYFENESGGSVAINNQATTTINETILLIGGTYRIQFYVEGKTSQANKQFAAAVYLNNVEQSETVIRTALADSYEGVSSFRGQVNATVGNNTLAVVMTNLDNNIFTWQRVRLEIMKVS